MSNVAIVTDSNSGITQTAGKELGISRTILYQKLHKYDLI